MALTNAQRQRRYRARRKAEQRRAQYRRPELATATLAGCGAHPARPPGRVSNGWLDNLPDALQETALGHKLKAICALDLGELESVEPPRGHGRDRGEQPVATAPQFQAAHRSRVRTHTGAPQTGSNALRPTAAAPPGPTSCRCGAEPALSAALQGPSTRPGGLRVPPAEPRIGPHASVPTPGPRCPCRRQHRPRPCQAPPRRRGGSISKRRTARGSVPTPARPKPARTRRTRPLPRHPGRPLAGAAQNRRSQRLCKAPPRDQVVSGYPLLNPNRPSCAPFRLPAPLSMPPAALTTALPSSPAPSGNPPGELRGRPPGPARRRVRTIHIIHNH